MTAFNIQVVDQEYLIEPQDNGTFRIMLGEEKIGTVYPTPGDLGIEWQTMDELDQDFVSQVGELISENQMDKSVL